MLEPRERTLLQKALEPPAGYRVDYAIGTTFSLDLVSLLLAPLAFTRFEADEEQSELQRDSLGLLESVRRYAKRITMFCQAGRIAYPRARYPQFAWLEKSVIQCRVPHGLFHPKVWVLRYTAERLAPRYRVLCLSRNLTIANSWDTLLALDGEVSDARRFEVDPAPLADFIEALPGLAAPEPEPAVIARTRDCANELRRVLFEIPPPFTGCEFRPLGVRDYRGWPFGDSSGDALIVSPFLSTTTIDRLAKRRSSVALVSAAPSLAELPSRPTGVSSFWVLDDDALVEMPPAAEETEGVSSEDMMQLAGLHAKLYVLEDGRDADVWTGSANATDPAFHNNVEFMVRLTGSRKLVGVTALMQSEKGAVRLCDVLKDAGSTVASSQRTEVDTGLESMLESAREWAASLLISGRAEAVGDKYDLVLDVGNVIEPPPDGVEIACWPVLTGESSAQRIGSARPLARFDAISLEGLSAFIAFRATASIEGQNREARFLLNVPLTGLPADREDKLLRGLIRDRSRLVQFLTLLLSDDGALEQSLASVLSRQTATSEDSTRADANVQGLFELLVRALDRSPERLQDVEGLVREFMSDSKTQEVLPEQFQAIWEPIWEASKALQWQNK